MAFARAIEEAKRDKEKTEAQFDAVNGKIDVCEERIRALGDHGEPTATQQRLLERFQEEKRDLQVRAEAFGKILQDKINFLRELVAKTGSMCLSFLLS
jgi:DNA-binding ferritin-like protein